MKKLLSATAIVLCTCGIAFSQTTWSSTPADTDTDTAVSSWDHATRDRFFRDDNMLRPEAELRSGWEALDATQQEQIRADCQARSADAGGTGSETMTSGGATTDSTTSSSGASSETTASTTTGSDRSANTAAGDTADVPDIASVQQLCTHVESF